MPLVPARRALAGERAVPDDGPEPCAEGPSPARLRDPAHVRGSRHRHRVRQSCKSYRQPPKNSITSRPSSATSGRPRFVCRCESRIHDEGRLPGSIAKKPAQLERRGHVASPTARSSTASGLDLPRRCGRPGRHRRRPVLHEFQVIADTGEDAIVHARPDYAANIEAAEACACRQPRQWRAGLMVRGTPTPGKATCEDVAALLGVPLRRR